MGPTGAVGMGVLPCGSIAWLKVERMMGAAYVLSLVLAEKTA